jgi:hypothetical protein
VDNWNTNNKNEVLGITYKTYCTHRSIVHTSQVMYKTKMCEVGVASSGITFVLEFVKISPLF